MNTSGSDDLPERIRRTLDEVFPLPPGVKLRRPRFGTASPSGFKPVPVARQAAHDGGQHRELFFIDCKDDGLGLYVRVQEQPNGELVAYVACTDASRVGKFASVALGGTVAINGTVENQVIRKSIPLVAEAGTEPSVSAKALRELDVKGVCYGSANFGALANIVRELGDQLAIIVFILE